ncbi:MAG: hypothetical protein JSV62_15140 [Promethearchaeota archaeon]|nr:MAG: hypothetical protein JSV62_15140 [Candidatus Lokiarchaeota archaeon]
MNEDEIKIFNCDLNDTNLFNCILDEVGENDLNSLSTTTSTVYDKTYINCINASLVTCLRNNRDSLEFPQVQLQITKNHRGEMLINQINIIVDKRFDDDLIFERINQCLRFVKKGCSLDDSVQLSIIQPEIKNDLKYFKVKLTEVSQLLQEIRDDKSKKENLFSIFKEISSNK